MPLGVYFTSGSLPRLPIRMTLLTLFDINPLRCVGNVQHYSRGAASGLGSAMLFWKPDRPFSGARALSLPNVFTFRLTWAGRSGDNLNMFKEGLVRDVPTTEKRITKGDLTRERIFTVALNLFREKGFEGTTMREVAAAANMSLGAAYYYFASKEAI